MIDSDEMRLELGLQLATSCVALLMMYGHTITGLTLDHMRHAAMGNTAEPMSTPITRYTCVTTK